MELAKEKCYITTSVLHWMTDGISIKYEYKLNRIDRLYITLLTSEPNAENPHIKFFEIKVYQNYFTDFENIPDEKRPHFLGENTFAFSYDFYVDLEPIVLHDAITNFFYKKGVSHDIIDKIWYNIEDKETVEIIHTDISKNTEEIVYKLHTQMLSKCKPI
jgi:hypothetical protein